jgi:DNA polymerase
MGATAAQAVLGPKIRVTRDRGVILERTDQHPHDTLVTVHPSAILRTQPPERDVAFDAFVGDLEVAARHLER